MFGGGKEEALLWIRLWFVWWFVITLDLNGFSINENGGG
jgi:hypothetical protein